MLTCLGDGHPFTYKRTVGGDADDRSRGGARPRARGAPARRRSTSSRTATTSGSTARPGFRLPVGLADAGPPRPVPRVPHLGRRSLASSRRSASPSRSRVAGARSSTCSRGTARYRNLAPYGEPQLGRRGLYRAMGGTDIPDLQLAMLWVLNLSDGATSLLDIAERSGLPFEAIRAAADLLRDHALLAPG